MTKRFVGGIAVVVTVVAIATVAIGALIGASEAARHRVGGLEPAEEAAELRAARDFWDNPYQRLLFFSMAVTSVGPPDAEGCHVVQVTAYSFFGREASTVENDCNQGQEAVMTSGELESRVAIAGLIAFLGVLAAPIGTSVGTHWAPQSSVAHRR